MSIQCDQLSKTYGRKKALQDFSATIPQEKVIGLIGDNGAGKSTLLKILGKIQKPSSGNIKGSYSSVYHSDLDMLYDWMSPKLTKQIYADLYHDFNPEKFDTFIKTLNVPQSTASDMSKGQRARLRLATTLARDVDLYLLDEPLSGIDALSRELILDMIRNSRQSNNTVIISTHEVRDADGIVDHVWILKEGHHLLDEAKSETSLIDQLKEQYHGN